MHGEALAGEGALQTATLKAVEVETVTAVTTSGSISRYGQGKWRSRDRFGGNGSAEYGMTHNVGGSGATAVVHIFSRER